MNEQVEKIAVLLQQHFENFPRRTQVKILRDLPIEHVAYYTIFAMEEAFGKIVPEGRVWKTVHPATPTFVNLGRNLLRGTVDPTEDKINMEYARAGFEAFNCLFEEDILGMAQDKKDARDPYRLKVMKDQEQWVAEAVAIIDTIEPPVPVYTRPQFEEPKPFTSFFSKEGGQLVRNIHPDAILENHPNKVPLVYDVINKHMQVKYRINTDVLDVYLQIQDDNIFTHQEKIDKGKLTQEQITGLYRERDKVLEIAKFVGERHFWEYAFYDSRSRLYSSSNYLTHAGCKLSKSLFKFSEEKEIGEEGYFWMYVHAANCWGYDKDSIDGRHDFADANMDGWMECANDPVNDKRWQDADDPFNFLSAIMEIKKAHEWENGPYEYPSGLPVAWDATCSGLQVLSALSRDAKSGALCNLTNTDERGDYYKMIAEHVWKECVYTPEEEKAFYAMQEELLEVSKLRLVESKKWYKENFKRVMGHGKVYWAKLVEQTPGISRKVCKRPCMTYFYSAQARTMADQMYGDFNSEFDEKLDFAYCSWLCDRIYKACEEKMPNPTKLMKLFQQLGLKDYSEGEHFTLRAPVTNFFMKQKYSDDKTARLKVGYKGKVIQLRVTIEKNARVKRTKVLSATSPNVVHMLDAQIVAGMLLHCDYPMSTIHDSFSSRPCDAGKLYEDTRTVFVDIFSNDVLYDILMQKDALGFVQDIIPGSLDLQEVYNNEHCFS